MRGRAGHWVAVAVVVLASAVVLAAAAAHATRAPRITSYAATSVPAEVLTFLAAGALLVAGSWTLVLGDRRGGVLCLLLAAAWSSPLLVGWEAGPPWVRALAWISAGTAVPLLVHLALVVAGPAPRLGPVTVRASYVVLVGTWVAAGLLRNPISDLRSWADLSDFAFVDADPAVVRALETAALSAVVVVVPLALLAALVVSRTPAGRDAAVLVAVVVVLVGEVGAAVHRLMLPVEQPTGMTGAAWFWVRGAGLTVLAIAVVWRADATRRLRRRMRRLVAELAARPPVGAFEEALASALRDDTVRVRYWVRERSTYVDAEGLPRPDDSSGDRGRVRVVRADHPVAEVTYDVRRVDSTVLEQHLGASARLAIDNERLRAESLVHLRDLTDSRSRIIAAADAQRQRLERDLHDGAQQRLLALLLELRLARGEEGTDTARGGAVDEALEAAALVLHELRDFAHGVFPAVLDEAGLAQALESLADQAPVPVELEVDLGERVPGAWSTVEERTAYAVARAVVEAAVGPLALRVHASDAAIAVEAVGVGVLDDEHLSDRVGGIGGELRRSGSRLEAVIPCA